MPFKLSEKFDQPLQVGDMVASMTSKIRPYLFMINLFESNKIIFGMVSKIDKKKSRRQYSIEWYITEDVLLMAYDEQTAMSFRDLYLTLHPNQTTL